MHAIFIIENILDDEDGEFEDYQLTFFLVHFHLQRTTSSRQNIMMAYLLIANHRDFCDLCDLLLHTNSRSSWHIWRVLALSVFSSATSNINSHPLVES